MRFTLVLIVTALVLQVAVGSQLKCSVENFLSGRSQKTLLKLLGSDEVSFESRSVVTVDKAVDGEVDVSLDIRGNGHMSSSNAAFLYVPASLLKLDETMFFTRLGRALKSVIPTEEKRTLVIVVSGKKEVLAQAEQTVKSLVVEAWTYLEKPSHLSLNVAEELNVRVVAVDSEDASSMKAGTEALQAALVDTKNHAVLHDVGENYSKSVDEGEERNSKPFVPHSQAWGFEVSDQCKTKALLWAQAAAQASAVRLQKYESREEFPVFIENLVTGALDRFKEEVGTAASVAVLKQTGEDIRRQVFAMMLPFFRRQVQLARVEVAKKFNEEAGEELEYTTGLMQDLRQIRAKTLKKYRKECAKLIPPHAPPSSWNTDFDRQQLEASLVEYLDNRQVQAQLIGVLPRGRKPVDIQFNVFANHPFGRDYRADPLLVGEKNDDEVFYDQGIADAKSASVPPSLARAVLKRNEAAAGQSRLESRHNRRQSEFAREMLMFPLSIKNPEVPLAAGKTKKPSSIEQARGDARMQSLGPERFVRWDLPDMKEPKAALDAATKGGKDRNSKKGLEVRDAVFNLLPVFKKGYYRHPKLNYENHPRQADGAKYAPQSLD